MKSSHPVTRLFLALALLLGCAAAAAARQTPPPPRPRAAPRAVGPVRWQEFKSEAGGFRVKLPAPPKIGQQPLQKGPITFMRHTHEARHGDYRFQIEYVDLPAGYDDAELTLEGGVAGLTQAMTADGARLLTREKITRGTCEGREVTLDLPPRGGSRAGFAHGRTFRSGPRMYLLLFVGTGAAAPTREAAQTFV
jgi:hypothetical protein